MNESEYFFQRMTRGEKTLHIVILFVVVTALICTLQWNTMDRNHKALLTVSRNVSWSAFAKTGGEIIGTASEEKSGELRFTNDTNAPQEFFVAESGRWFPVSRIGFALNMAAHITPIVPQSEGDSLAGASNAELMMEVTSGGETTRYGVNIERTQSFGTARIQTPDGKFPPSAEGVTFRLLLTLPPQTQADMIPLTLWRLLPDGTPTREFLPPTLFGHSLVIPLRVTVITLFILYGVLANPKRLRTWIFDRLLASRHPYFVLWGCAFPPIFLLFGSMGVLYGRLASVGALGEIDAMITPWPMILPILVFLNATFHLRVERRERSLRKMAAMDSE